MILLYLTSLVINFEINYAVRFALIQTSIDCTYCCFGIMLHIVFFFFFCFAFFFYLFQDVDKKKEEKKKRLLCVRKQYVTGASTMCFLEQCILFFTTLLSTKANCEKLTHKSDKNIKACL